VPDFTERANFRELLLKARLTGRGRVPETVEVSS
jgi:hypothetical protein